VGSDLLTISAIAKRLKLPESSVRFYRDKYTAFIPTTGEGRKKRYRSEALDVIGYIASQSRAGVPSDILEQGLVERFPMDAEPQQETQQPQERSLTTAAAQQQALETLEKSLTETLRAGLDDQGRELLAAVEEQNRKLTADLAEQNGELRAELSAITARLQQQEAQQAAILEAIAAGQRQGRRWWRLWDRR